MSAHTSLMRLAVASSPLLLPLEAVASQTSSSSMGNHLLLLIIVAALGIVVLATLDLRRLASVLGNEDQGTPGERRAEAEPDESLRFMRDTVEQLDCISVVLRTATDALSNAVDNIASPRKYVSPASNETCSAAAERVLPVGQDSENLRTSAGLAPAAGQPHERGEGNRDTPTRMQDIADGISLIDAVSSQADLLALGVAAQAACIRSRYPEAGEVASEMRMLAEYSQLKAREIGATARSSAPLAERVGTLLARDKTPIPPSRKNARHLLFTIGDQRCAVSTLNVTDILIASRLSPEPSMPPSMRGVIDLHDARVPVIDLATRIGGEPIKIGWNTRIVILDIVHEDRQDMIGVLADTVGEIVSITPMNIESPPTSIAHVRCDLIQGMGKVDGRAVILLDIGRGLSAKELGVLHSAAQPKEQESMPT